LLVLPREVQDLIDAGRVPMSSAYAICTVPDAAERERLIQAVLDGRLTRDRLVAETKAVKAGRPNPRTSTRQRTARERVVIKLGEGRSVAVSAPTLSVDSVVTWFIDLAEQLRHAGADGRPLAEIARSISGNGK
ncbi:MAG TPA: hypothetical protein PKC49_14515, partial [Phycisphaerae bacterium]|nr:hypothetical protein [Phycisphaerae bacterium]